MAGSLCEAVVLPGSNATKRDTRHGQELSDVMRDYVLV